MTLVNSVTLMGMELLEFEKYEDYLDTFISNADYRFLRDKALCRSMATLNYNPGKKVFTQSEFEENREFLREQLAPRIRVDYRYAKRVNSFDAVLAQFAIRERPNYQKNLSTIIFLTHRDKNGFEVCGFIDFGASLQQCNQKMQGATDWVSVYEEKVKLRPKPHDLSYFDMNKNVVTYNNSENYLVQHDVNDGLIFVHRGDQKKICVSSKRANAERNYIRSVHCSHIYGHVIFFDHIVRKKI